MKLFKIINKSRLITKFFMAELSDEAKRSQFGTRYLIDESKIYEHNAWDNVDLSEEEKRLADLKLNENSSIKFDEEQREKLEKNAALNWDQFYNKHENKFFKDRHWLFTTFPELNHLSNDLNKDVDNKKEIKDKIKIFEIGCGVGNTVFPLIEANSNPNLFIYCCDFSSTAIDIVKSHELYDESKCKAFVLDVTNETWDDLPFSEQSLDIVTLIFVLSAIDPNKMQHVINQISKYLKIGGLLLFRDYGIYDMTQLRFKKGNCIKDNFYVRGDGTRVYYFTESLVDEMFVKGGLKKQILHTDKRLQVNRAKQLKMYRVWIFAKYCKI